MSAVHTAAPQPLSIAAEVHRDEVVVAPVGDLDLATADALDEEVRRLRRSGCARVVIDLRGVAFLDSTALRVLLCVRNDAKRDGVELALIPGPHEVQRIFALTGTSGLFTWRRDARDGTFAAR